VIGFSHGTSHHKYSNHAVADVMLSSQIQTANSVRA